MAPGKTLIWEIPMSQRSVEYFLKSSYESWGEDVTDVLSSRAHRIVQTIFPDDNCTQRFNTLALYYEVLVRVCRAMKEEPEALHAILTFEIFHRCLLACAAAFQVLQITHTSSTVTKMFPADYVLKSSGITAFDLSHTITANFVTHEDSFPGYFSRHLNSFKEQLLESMAWKKGSSLYNYLSLARPYLSAQINLLELFAQSMPSFNETMPDLEAAETKIDLFLCEISMLGAVRIRGMVEWLQLSQRTREDIYSLFQRILNERTHLFFNRHIDQIMLCCFYMVAQFSKLNLSIWEILHSYKQQPESRSPVFRSVFVDCPLAGNNDDGQQQRVGIITFYNDIFTPSVWPLVMELVTDEETVKSGQLAEVVNSKDGHLAQCLVSPKIVPFPRFPVMHREKRYPTKNLRVSPLSSSEIIMLGAVRIDGMVEELQLSQQTGENVYCLFQRILTLRPHIFSDFHIDQIILCCFRAVAKDLTFPEIIAGYRLQPQYTPPVFHSEFGDWPLACLDPSHGKTKGQAHISSIVKYYKDIFFPYVKPLLSELYTVVTPARSYKIAEFINKADGHLAQCPGSPEIFTFPSLPVMSVEEKSAAHYACVSPIGSSEIIMLGAVRIKSMVEMLGFSQQIRENVYRLFQTILHQHTSLFFDRHIDHIILCCFCAVAKISKLSLTFKEVISSYVNQPQCNPRVFDSVYVDWALACQDSASGKRKGQEHVDFGTFCNDIFLPSVEPLLLELFTEGTSGQKRKKMAPCQDNEFCNPLTYDLHAVRENNHLDNELGEERV